MSRRAVPKANPSVRSTEGTPVSRSECLLQLHAVRKAFGGVAANDGIDLVVNAGAIVGLIGPNGSGKTTLFNGVTGLAGFDSGRVIFDGHDIASLGAAAIARSGLLRTFQQAGVYSGLSCLQSMLVSRDRRGETLAAMWRKPDPGEQMRALELLDTVGLRPAKHQLAGDLSYGQRKLLEFAMAMMHKPRLLLLDEPTAGVSPTLIPLLVAQLRAANARLGVTLLVIEHNMQVIMDLAQEVYCLAQGRVLASGSPAQVRADARVVQAYLGGA